MDAEYESLRAEIVGWQNFRFVLVGAATAFAGAVMAFAAESHGDRRLSLALIISDLFGASALSVYAGRVNAKIGTYLQRFYEPPSDDPAYSRSYSLGWEGRIRKFEEYGTFVSLVFSLDRWLAIIYLVLALVSSLTLLDSARSEHWAYGVTSAPIDSSDVILAILWAALIVALVALAIGPRRQRYFDRWEKVRRALPVRGSQAAQIQVRPIVTEAATPISQSDSEKTQLNSTPSIKADLICSLRRSRLADVFGKGLDRYLSLVLAVAVGLAVGVGLVRVAFAMGADHREVWLEIAKAGAQLGILSVIGGAFAAFLKGRENIREQRRRLNDYRLSVLRSSAVSYNTVKAVRRNLRALGFGTGSRDGLSSEEAAKVNAQLQTLNEAQLTLERLKREVTVWRGAFRESQRLYCLLEDVEQYVGHVLRDWENHGSHIMVGATPQVLLQAMPKLDAFVAPAEESFKEGAAKPMEDVEELIRKEALPSSEAAPLIFEIIRTLTT